MVFSHNGAMTVPMRVYELAKRFGVDSRTVMSVLAAAGAGTVRSASSKLDATQVSLVESALGSGDRPLQGEPVAAPVAAPGVDVGSGSESRRDPDRGDEAALGHRPASQANRADLRQLILSAFEDARTSGKEDWRHMSTAVLKNRISQGLGRPFSEREYGYSRILDLALDFSSLLEVDVTQRPPALHLVAATTEAQALDESVSVRPDLWKAVIDFRGRQPYFLHQGRAVPASELTGEPDVHQALPTITEQDFWQWRQEFASAVVPKTEQGGPPGQMATKVASWLSEGRGTVGLPVPLRGRWNLHLKTKVRDRLLEWYGTIGIDVPSDLVVGSRHESQGVKLSAEDQLRAALIDAVRSMTYEELRQVQVPAVALLRRRR